MKEYLNVLQLCQNGSRALGPGLRYVIWVQGCPFNCPHCETPEGHSFEPNFLVDISKLAEDIVSRPNIEGITISGGEPMEQAGELYALLEKVLEKRPELTVISYTGYLLEQLTSEEQENYISKLDVLIDGRYIHEKNDNQGIRGSSNQQVHFLTDRLKEYKEEITSGKRKLEIIFKGNTVTTIGLTNRQK